jgi:AhpD family alkylhydroperoxidase
MARIHVLDPAEADGRAKELLDSVQAKLGATPNSMKAMAGSAVLEGYLGLSSALASGSVRPAIVERIALAVAETNGCSYCLSAHSYVAEHVLKIPADEIKRARTYRSNDATAQAALRFAAAVLRGRGAVSAEEFDAARAAGLTDAELAELVAHVALNVLTNFFNHAFEIDIDFPVVAPGLRAAA